LIEKYKFEQALKETNQLPIALWVSGFILAVGFFTSFGSFIYNKKSGTKVDNANFMAPMIVCLNIYDFVSDINLSIDIFLNELTIFSFGNIFFNLGLLSIMSVIIPFCGNIYYAVMISSQKTVKQSPSARAWFSSHLNVFILLCVVTGGTYPSLAFVSSRIFGLECLNAGFLSSELYKLSKIKIRTTIWMENMPQLVIQILYSYLIGTFEQATILAFVGSLLSIIHAFVVNKAQKNQNEEVNISKYYIGLFQSHRLRKEIVDKIKLHKGAKERLSKSLCSSFGVPAQSIEIGFVEEQSNGCLITIQQSVFSKNLQTVDKNGISITVRSEYYLHQRLLKQKHDVLETLLNHFDIDNKDKSFEIIHYFTYPELKKDCKEKPSVANEGGLNNFDIELEEMKHQTTGAANVDSDSESLAVEMIPVQINENDLNGDDIKSDIMEIKNHLQNMNQTLIDLKSNNISSNIDQTTGATNVDSDSNDISPNIERYTSTPL